MKFTKQLKAIALISAICVGNAFAADTIKIGVTGPFTGGSSSMGVSMRDGVRLATKEINDAGGIFGRKIQLIERDDEAQNARGVAIAQELVNNEKIIADVGFINTGVALPPSAFTKMQKSLFSITWLQEQSLLNNSTKSLQTTSSEMQLEMKSKHR
jgi:branched-chain amino acid transport system substrate-binding protein